MRWRSSNGNNDERMSDSTTSSGHDNTIPAMSSSMDDDEPDSSSFDPVQTDDHNMKGQTHRHGRLGFSGSDLPPSAGRLLEKENSSLSKPKGDDKNSADVDKGSSSSLPAAVSISKLHVESLPLSSQPKVISSTVAKVNPGPKEDDDKDGLDHSHPLDDSSETDTQSTPWKPQKTQSTCEFTHTIMNYSQKRESGCKKAEYSSTTLDEFGNRWRLIVYVNGNGRASNHHLSLFLQVADADDLPFGWKKAVSYVLTLEHPSGANLSYAKRNPDKTFKLCPKAIDWGWSQFITSDRIQQEGFVSKDSLTVRASVTVKSSSVSIDPDDAELYLKCAVEEGGAEAVKLCLVQGASVNCKFKDDLYTPLHTACSSGTNGGSMEVLNLLLEKGADGNACNKWRETPLLIAANNGHRAAVEALLKHGADPSLCSEAGWSALTFAAHKGYDDIVALLLRAGAPVNCRVTEDSSTPLHKACAGSKQGHLSAVKQLLEGGADVHALNKWRETPLLTAANHGQSGAVDSLLKSGADPCKCTDTGWSPLSIAAYKGHDSVVSLLLEEGAPTEEADPTLSALLQAATKGLPNTVELLLRHGADHTVTTKKGDTALSILVEQNLIDAAVEMVTEYKASVPRCSRDRKKVQRARLLINLRMKQHQREGKHLVVATDDDETDDEQSDDPKSAQHHEGGRPAAVTPRSSKKTKKGRQAKLSAEEQARAAEEALLLELEQEDAKAKKEEAEANSKRAKKKKKKERERLQKMKEEQERREKEEMEAKERERVRVEREEKERRERQRKMKEQREREMKEAAQREVKATAAARRKEKEEKERKQREMGQKLREKQERDKRSFGTSLLPGGAVTDKRGKGKGAAAANKKPGCQNTTTGRNGAVDSSQTRKAAGTTGAATLVPATRGALVKNRGWETAKQVFVKHPDVANSWRVQDSVATMKNPARQPGTAAKETHNPILPPSSSSSSTSTVFLVPRPSQVVSGQQIASGFDQSKPGNASVGNGVFPGSTQGQERSPPDAFCEAFSGGLGTMQQMKFAVGFVEHPAVALFRQEKVTELLRRCRVSLSVVDELALKRVLYRWIVRASHSQSSYMDCIIPSWVDFDQLATFFQRQFIAESRKASHGTCSRSEMVSMETLREAGSEMANLCHSQAKELVRFRLKMEEQLPLDWSDVTLMLNATDAGNRSDVGVMVDYAGRTKAYFTAKEFTTLRTRYVGQPNRFLTSLFAVKARYETKAMLLGESNLDFYLTAATKACLSVEASVSAELWSDPLSVLESNVFWGNFEDVDSLFGGLVPFGRDEGGGEELLSRHGGSVCVLLPFDNMVASRYMHRMLDVLEECDQKGVPVSFVVFIHAESFHDLSGLPTMKDLHLLDPRLGDKNKPFLRRIESLAPGQHVFKYGNASTVSTKGTLLVLLQNEPAERCFVVTDGSMTKIKESMGANVPANAGLSMVPSIGFNGDYKANESPGTTQHSGYFDGFAPISPVPQQPAAFVDFGGTVVGGKSIAPAFSGTETRRAPPSRRGRLFELVDDGEEEQLHDVDVVSGMLTSLNVDLFHNSVSQEVDIEAISLMGISGPPPRSLPPGSSPSSRFD